MAIGIALLVGTAAAQTPNQNSKSSAAPAASPAKPTNNAEAERIRNERRQQARTLLVSLATEARSFRDQSLRTRTLTRIAELLWPVDNEQARALFHRAWEAAEITDQDEKTDQNFRQQLLTVAGRLDRELAEEFLQKMKDEQERSDPKQKDSSDVWELDQASEHRLEVAVSLLRSGDVERALQFADPVLNRVTISTINFLTDLRDKAPAEADQRYAALLAASANAAGTDANTVSLLSSYLFSPQTYFTFTREGVGDTGMPRTSLPAPNVTPQLRLAFFQMAAAILSRPQPPPEQDQTTTGIAGKYMLLKRLLPVFDAMAPREIAAAMHSQFDALSSLVGKDLREQQDVPLKRGLEPEKSLDERLQPLLDQIDHARTSAEQDDLYFRLAVISTYNDDLRARVYVGKIAESEFRKRAQAWVDWELVIQAIEKKKVPRALELLRLGELNHVQKVWVMTQSAKLLAKTDSQKALSLTEEAADEAHRIEGSDADRPRSLIGIANAFQLLDASRVWDALFEAVKAANAAEGFTGDKEAIKTFMNSKGQLFTKTHPVADFDLRGIFEQVVRSDYDRAIELAAGFQSEAARANATIAMARAVLSDTAPRKSTVPKPTVH